MSTVNVQPTTNARSAVAYALYGTSGDRYQRFEDEEGVFNCLCIRLLFERIDA